jgi:hypothetical protein
MQTAYGTLPIGALLLALFVALVLGAIAWAVVHEKHQRRALHEELRGFGFTLVATPPVHLVRKVSAFGSPGREAGAAPTALRNVYHRTLAGGDLYLYDIEDTHGSGGALPGYLAIIAPALRLPRLMLVPALMMPGAMGDLLGGVARNALNWAGTSKGLHPVPLEHVAGFARHYTAMGLDEDAVRAFLTPERMTGILTLDHKHAIEGEEDTFVIATGVAAAMASQARSDDAAIDVYTLSRDAEILLALLGENSHPKAGYEMLHPTP